MIIFTFTDKSNTVHLKVTPNYQGFSSVQDHHVPIFLSTKAGFKTHEWDLTTQQVGFYGILTLDWINMDELSL